MIIKKKKGRGRPKKNVKTITGNDYFTINEIANIEEAEHYLMDDLLSKRLLELTRILAYEIENTTAEEIFG